MIQVHAMLKSPEYATIKTDYDTISRANFPKSYFHPADMRFINSDALFPSADLSRALASGYEAQCNVLCYGSYPSWSQLRGRFQELREWI